MAKAAKAVRVTGTPPSDVDDILENMEELLTGWQPHTTWSKSYTALKIKDTNILKNILSGAINSIGREQVARNCQANASLVKSLAFHICYGSSDFKWNTIEGDIAAITAIIYGRNLTVDEAKSVQDIIDTEHGYEAPE